MAESAARTVLERYSAIERSYCDEHWTTVIQEGQQLLLDVSRSADPVPEGLRERLELLMAHAYLYGFGDRDSAEDLYQAVLRSGAEASLRQIAEQGLQQCNLPATSPGGGATSEPTKEPEAAVDAVVAIAPTEPAGEAGEGSRRPAAASEPPAEVAAPSDLQDAAELAWLSAPVPPQGGAPTPVMPWLQEGEGGSEASAPTLGSFSAEALAVEPGATSRAASLLQAAPAAAAAAGLGAATQPAVVDAGTARSAAVAGSGEPLAAAPGSAARARPDPAAGSVAAAGAEGLARAEEILIPDVVEEPELVELRLADPELVEELRERLRQRLSRTGAAEAEPPPAASSAGAAVPLSLEKTPVEPSGVVDPSPLDSEALDPAASGGWAPSGAPQGLIDAGEEGLSSPASHGRDADSPEQDGEDASGGLFRPRSPKRLRTPGPFASLPQSVGEEDSEMLMGLLKVELG